MSKPTYWTGLEELEQDPAFLKQAADEFPKDMPIDKVMAEVKDEDFETHSNRRDFLKVMGFGMTAAALAACAEGPVKKAIPYVNKPDDIIPGVANWYASTTFNGNPCLVKTREGRPIKLEGNPDSPVTRGGISTSDQASILDMYDSGRMEAPRRGRNTTDWDTIDRYVREKLNGIKAAGGAVRILSGTVMSPSTKQIITEFLGQFEDGAHVMYDAVSYSAIAKAHEMVFGRRAIPTYSFDKAMTIVSLNADFLGNWISSEVFAADYMVNRDPDKKMSRHLQFESLLTISGGKADMRFPFNPSQEGIAVLNLYNKVAAKMGRGQVQAPRYDVAMEGLELAASELAANAGKSLVVSGSNDVSVQVVVAAINEMLGNYGNTLDIANSSHYKQGDDEAMAQLAGELEQGKVSALLIYGANPVYNSPFASTFEKAIPGLELSLSFANKEDETSTLCEFAAPDNYFLESWGDAQQSDTEYSLLQPTIYPIFKTRQAQDSLLKWSGSPKKYMDYLKEYWQQNLLTGEGLFRDAWNDTLRKGVYTYNEGAATDITYQLTDDQLISEANKVKASSRKDVPEGELEILFYANMSVGDGSQANNPWLQELPDPITRCAWDNYVTVPFVLAESMGLKNEDLVDITIGEDTYRMPAIVQVGQARQTLAVALGYGRTNAGKVAIQGNGQVIGGTQVAGQNFFAATSMSNGAVQYHATGVSMAKAGGTYPLALMQTFNYLYDSAKKDLFGSDYDRTYAIIEETTTADIASGEYKSYVKKRQDKKDHLVTLWDSHFQDPETARNIHWKMAIDLNKCTGCGSCVVACHAENNVPVVGKSEFRRRRDMHWLRIDRYYAGDPENPDVAFQPMLCQHCDNAPCETVCPVLATVHSNEGLNQMTYNRCVGTRYCANNCPYKVRRFNWFNYWNDEPLFGDYYTHSKLGKLVLNPDVTVRFRGVMEKCSFCVQRLQDAKLRAKVNAKSTYAKPEDGDVQVACQQSCPTGAIVFGDFNDPNSAVSKAFRQPRSYAVLEEIKTLPSIQYQALVRNRTAAESKQKAEARLKARGMAAEAATHGEGDHA